jgi:hypothetical protein
MPPLHLRSAVEALLFSSDQPLSLSLLAEALDCAARRGERGAPGLGAEYKSREAGVELREMAGGWIVTSTAEQHEWVARMLRGKRKMRLSRARARDAGDHRLQAAGDEERGRGDPRRGLERHARDAARALAGHDQGPLHGGRPAAALRSTPSSSTTSACKDLADLPRPEELRALVAAREPEQMEMLELDTDGLPLSLVGPQ